MKAGRFQLPFYSFFQWRKERLVDCLGITLSLLRRKDNRSIDCQKSRQALLDVYQELLPRAAFSNLSTLSD
jgi:hypothetical protein